MTRKPIRVLCLHGIRTSGAILEQVMKAFVGRFEDAWEFVYLDAPNPGSAPAFENVQRAFPSLVEKGVYEWFSYEEIDGKVNYTMIEKSLEYVENIIKNDEIGFDVLLGYSQVSCSPNYLSVERNNLINY